jgi:ribonuclease Z
MRQSPVVRRRAIAIPALLALTIAFAPHARAQASSPVAARSAPPLPQGEIRVTLLGTGTPRPLMDRFGPSILVEAGDEKLIFDVGRGAMQRLLQLDVSYADITGVLLTHLHSDHIVGLPDLWLTGWLISRRTTPTPLWGPTGTTRMARSLEAAYAFDRDIRVRDDKVPAAGGHLDAHDISERVVFDRNGVRVTSFLVDHGVIRPALGYRVDAGGRSVVLSGDTRYSTNLIAHAKGVDLLIHEVGAASAEELRASALSRSIIAHHTTPEKAAQLFNEVHPRLAVFSHIVMRGVTVDDMMRTTRLTYSGPLQLGEDLMRFHVGDSVTIERMPPSPPKRASP